MFSIHPQLSERGDALSWVLKILLLLSRSPRNVDIAQLLLVFLFLLWSGFLLAGPPELVLVVIKCGG